ncbi:MAG: hypothetical protein JWR81_873 [Pseudonocardia sp.]|nr:hypothetical protein [Pseudonocardia sp.]
MTNAEPVPLPLPLTDDEPTGDASRRVRVRA